MIIDQLNGVYKKGEGFKPPFDNLPGIVRKLDLTGLVLLSASANNETPMVGDFRDSFVDYHLEDKGHQLEGNYSLGFTEEEYKKWKEQQTWRFHADLSAEKDSAIISMTNLIPMYLKELWDTLEKADTLDQGLANYKKESILKIAEAHRKYRERFDSVSDEDMRKVLLAAQLGIYSHILEYDRHYSFLYKNKIAFINNLALSMFEEKYLDSVNLDSMSSMILILLQQDNLPSATVGSLLEMYLKHHVTNKKSPITCEYKALGEGKEIGSNNKLSLPKINQAEVYEGMMPLSTQKPLSGTVAYFPSVSNYPFLDFVIYSEADKSIKMFQLTVAYPLSNHADSTRAFADPNTYGETGILGKFKEAQKNLAEAWLKFFTGNDQAKIRTAKDGFANGVEFYFLGYTPEPGNFGAFEAGSRFIDILSFPPLAPFLEWLRAHKAQK